MLNFLHLSYEGGVEYKNGIAPDGLPILIAHESEAVSLSETADGLSRFDRRRRMAAVENLVRPIVDKYAAYLTRTPPQRSTRNADAAQRLGLDRTMRKLVLDGLRHGEAWVGFDAINISSDADVTRAEVAAIDPQNRGLPYLVRRLAEDVVDFEISDDGSVSRVVFEERVVRKESLVSPRVAFTQYREWTSTEWVLYEAVKERRSENGMTAIEPVEVTVTSGTAHVREIARGKHRFGVCPWVCFKPDFPSIDLAELNRSLFNIDSLLDEEIFKNTFTQKYVVGATSHDLSNLTSGPGNMFAFPNPDTKLGVLGAIEGHAITLMQRLNDRRDSIYSLVSMENSRAKNVAEAAEKKRRDMESLYASLVKITEAVEAAENELLVAMGLSDYDDPATLSQYDRRFDVSSLSDFVDDIKRIISLPFITPSVKRSLSLAAVTKISPFIDTKLVEQDMMLVSDVGESVADTVPRLKEAGVLTPDIAAELLGVPADQREEFVRRFDQHTDQSAFAGAPLVTQDDDMAEQDNAADGEVGDDMEEEVDDAEETQNEGQATGRASQ